MSITTTTVRRTISSTVPNLTSGYSTTTINGKLIVIFRSAYRVNGMNRVQGFDNNSKYQIIQPWFHSGTSIYGDLISILIFLFRLVYRPWFQVKYKTKPFVHKDDDTIADVHEENDTIDIKKLVVLFQIKYKMSKSFDMVQLVVRR